MNIPTDSKRTSEPDGEAYLSHVGERVRTARTARGMTRKALSQASGVSERYLADLETGTGNASLLVLRHIARAVEVAIEALVGDGISPSGRSVQQSPRSDASSNSQRRTGSLGDTSDAAHIMSVLERLTPDELHETRQWLAAQFTLDTKAQPRRIALIGLRGAGKTTLGEGLASNLGVAFIELDREIERASGMDLAEIFATLGHATFRRFEYDCLEAVIANYPSCVIATGGSLVTESKTYERLLETCETVWLKAAPDLHMSRVVAQGDLRPMGDNPQAMDDLASILVARSPLYARAHHTLDTTGLTPDLAQIALSKLLRSE
jgi:XRE family transcriptional regulator, aerobic/anaerobic benzoate catabolism transcriptional regulator